MSAGPRPRKSFGAKASHQPGKPRGEVPVGPPYETGGPEDGYSEFFPTYSQGGPSLAASSPSSRRAGNQAGNSRPIKVIHVGNYMVRAGIEVWLKALILGSNPERICFRVAWSQALLAIHG